MTDYNTPKKFWSKQLSPLTRNEQLNSMKPKNLIETSSREVVAVKNGGDLEPIPVVFSSREDFTLLFGLKWFDELNFEFRTYQVPAVATNRKRNQTTAI